MKHSIKEILLHSALFVVTFVTATFAGGEWTYGTSVFMPGYSWTDFVNGMPYSIPFLLILTVHEFGHYFTATHYRVRTTLPYFIPLPPIGLTPGTLGALIRLKSRVYSKRQNFDIGIAGPLAGFIVALGVLLYGFTHLPPPEHIFLFHPEYQQYGLDYAKFVYSAVDQPAHIDVVLGKNLLFLFFENFVADPARIPNPHEIMHYPFLFAGFLSLIFTSINLLPIGQLDGGHVLYGLVGFKRHRIIATIIFVVFLVYAGMGVVTPYDGTSELMWEIPLGVAFAYACLSGLMLPAKDTLLYAVLLFAFLYVLAWWLPGVQGYPGWLLFALVIGRFIRVPHPPAPLEEPLGLEREILGWIALLVFVLCFSPNPIDIIAVFPTEPVPSV